MAATLLLALALSLTQSRAATQASHSFTAVADAYVRADQPQKNFGAAKSLIVDGSPLIHSYLRFNVGDIDGTVTKATLRLHVNNSTPAGYAVSGVADNTWGERQIKHVNAPSIGAVVASSGPVTPGMKDVDVTPLVTGEGLVSLALTTASAAQISIASREDGTLPKPELIIETVTGDAEPPETAITDGPADMESATTASFGFSASEDGSSFECALDEAAFAACSSPTGYTDLADGEHTFRVRATDAAANVDPTPASRTWIVDTGPPETTIAEGPSGTYRLGSADFEFASSEPDATFECSLDRGEFEPCPASPTFDVANGSRELTVRAVDAAGTKDPTPEQRRWWADGLVPNGNFETPSPGWTEQGFTMPGWKPYNGSTEISLVNGGLAGETAGRVSTTGTATMLVRNTPLAINSTVAGDTYTLRGHVRSEQPGEKVCLRLREWAGTTVVTSRQACGTTSGSWTEFAPVTLTVARDGSELGVDVYQASTTSAGENFDIDGISLSDGKSPSVPAPPPDEGDPTLLAAGDVASCWSSGDESVSRLLDTLPGTIAIPGDTEQNHGSADEFSSCYDPSWGRHRARTMPAVGDHEYKTPGATGFFDYFGASAGESGKGWYSYDLGNWHIVVLNSNCFLVGGCTPGSEQYEWLRADLAENGGDCIGAYWHHPLFSSGSLHGGLPNARPFWDLLYQYKAEWVLGGNDHNYQRFAPQTPTGELDSQRGIRQFIVGTGGTRLDSVGTALPNTQVQSNSAFGILRFDLHDASYDWEFVPQDGKTFTDSGSTPCSPLGDIVPPETTIDNGPFGTVTSDSATFEFSSNETAAEFRCSLDDQPFSACSAPRTYNGLAEGEHVFRVKAVDAGENEDATPASRTWTVVSNNLLANGSFEGSLSGWFAYESTASLVPGGPAGSSFARVAPNDSVSVYTLTTSPRPVGSSVAGTTYEAAGWLRSETPGNKVCLQIRERVNGAVAKNTASCRTATGDWERFMAVKHVAVGGGSLEVYAARSGALPGESFDLDGLSLIARP